MPIQREYLSPNEIAELLGVSAFTIRRYIKLGELRAVKLLGGFRVHREDLQRFLKAHEVNPAEEELSPEETVAVKVKSPTPPPAATEQSMPKPVPNETVAVKVETPALFPAAAEQPLPKPAPGHPITIPPRSSKKTHRARLKKSRRSEKT